MIQQATASSLSLIFHMGWVGKHLQRTNRHKPQYEMRGWSMMVPHSQGWRTEIGDPWYNKNIFLLPWDCVARSEEEIQGSFLSSQHKHCHISIRHGDLDTPYSFGFCLWSKHMMYDAKIARFPFARPLLCISVLISALFYPHLPPPSFGLGALQSSGSSPSPANGALYSGQRDRNSPRTIIQQSYVPLRNGKRSREH